MLTTEVESRSCRAEKPQISCPGLNSSNVLSLQYGNHLRKAIANRLLTTKQFDVSTAVISNEEVAP